MSVLPQIISLDSTVKRSASILTQRLDEDIVMANIDSGLYFGIDNSSKQIWELLESPLTVKEICSQLSKVYAVDAATCERDVLEFVNELVNEGLIQVV